MRTDRRLQTGTRKRRGKRHHSFELVEMSLASLRKLLLFLDRTNFHFLNDSCAGVRFSIPHCGEATGNGTSGCFDCFRHVFNGIKQENVAFSSVIAAVRN